MSILSWGPRCHLGLEDNIKMRILRGEDFANLLHPQEFLSAAKEAFMLYDTNAYKMPTRLHMTEGPNTYLVMPLRIARSFLNEAGLHNS